MFNLIKSRNSARNEVFFQLFESIASTRGRVSSRYKRQVTVGLIKNVDSEGVKVKDKCEGRHCSDGWLWIWCMVTLVSMTRFTLIYDAVSHLLSTSLWYTLPPLVKSTQCENFKITIFMLHINLFNITVVILIISLLKFNFQTCYNLKIK